MEPNINLDVLERVLSSFYRKEMASRIRRSMGIRKLNGECMHLAPFGFMNARDANGRSIILPDPRSYIFLQEARRMRKDGQTWCEIAIKLRAEGLKSKRGNAVSAQGLAQAIRQVEAKDLVSSEPSAVVKKS